MNTQEQVKTRGLHVIETAPFIFPPHRELVCIDSATVALIKSQNPNLIVRPADPVLDKDLQLAVSDFGPVQLELDKCVHSTGKCRRCNKCRRCCLCPDGFEARLQSTTKW